MRLILLASCLLLSLSQVAYIPNAFMHVGPILPNSAYANGIVSTSSLPPTRGGSTTYIPHPVYYAQLADQTLFPLVDKHFQSLGVRFYKLVAMFLSNDSQANLYRYNLYYVTDQGLLMCAVSSYPKLQNGFIAIACLNYESTAVLTSNVGSSYL